jgi:hypothetical protein
MERYRKTIYCDWDFLESYISMLGDDKPDIDVSFSENDEVIQCIKELILSSDVKLFINASKEKYDEKLKDIEKKRKNAAKKGREVVLTQFEKLLHYIDLKQQNNLLHVHFNCIDIDYENLSQKEQFLNAMFLTSSPKEICQKAMDDYGVIAICAENINDFRCLLYGVGTAIRKHETNKWSSCLASEKTVPCNSLIIVDNYILSKTDLIKENLTDILDTLIPSQLSSKIDFQITIFTSSVINAKDKLQSVTDVLKELRPDINFSVAIIKSSSDNFHDRNIISNNILISCGGGFDLFKCGKSQKTTTVSLHNPFITSTEQWLRKAYSDILHDTLKVYDSSPKFGENNIGDTYPNFMLGESRNRLIETIR